MSRTYKRSYTKAKAFTSSCRNHGNCDYCKDNRTWFDKKHRPSVPTIQEAMVDLQDDPYYPDDSDLAYDWDLGDP